MTDAVAPKGMHDELYDLARIARRLAAWDAEWELPGFDPPQAPRAPTPLPAPTPRVARAVVPTLLPTSQDRPELTALRDELGDCRRCKLAGLGRRTIVFGEGSPTAELVFVGEGPGYNEDVQGRPFVGASGELLDKMINAMGFARSDVYICNVVKCRPPENRNPEPDEIVACQPFLLGQVRAIQPKVVVALGKFAAQTLLGTTEAISRLRGTFHPYFGAKLMPTFHPSYLLHNPSDKRLVWADLKLVMAELKGAQ